MSPVRVRDLAMPGAATRCAGVVGIVGRVTQTDTRWGICTIDCPSSLTPLCMIVNPSPSYRRTHRDWVSVAPASCRWITSGPGILPVVPRKPALRTLHPNAPPPYHLPKPTAPATPRPTLTMLSPDARNEWLTLLVIGLLVGVSLVLLGYWPLAVAVAVVIIALLLFFRDPNRQVPNYRNVAVAPSDGTVSSVHELDRFEPFDGPAVCVRIFMSVFDVHINRVPCHGRVASMSHQPGAHGNTLNPKSAEDNESMTTAPGPPRQGPPRRRRPPDRRPPRPHHLQPSRPRRGRPTRPTHGHHQARLHHRALPPPYPPAAGQGSQGREGQGRPHRPRRGYPPRPRRTRPLDRRRPRMRCPRKRHPRKPTPPTPTPETSPPPLPTPTTTPPSPTRFSTTPPPSTPARQFRRPGDRSPLHHPCRRVDQQDRAGVAVSLLMVPEQSWTTGTFRSRPSRRSCCSRSDSP